MTRFKVTNGTNQCLCLSPDSRLVAVAAESTVYIWDITSSNPHLVETFLGHTDNVTSLAFASSSTLISASWDESVKFWKIGTLLADPVVNVPGSTPITLPLISSISIQARDGIAISSDTDGVVKDLGYPS